MNCYSRFSIAALNIARSTKNNEEDSPKSQSNISGETGFAKKRIMIKKKRERISGVDLEKSVNPEDIPSNFDKIRPITYNNETNIDFDQGESQQATKVELSKSESPSSKPKDKDMDRESKNKVIEVENSILED